ncbi:FG-GAP repeat domain-containing protein [Flavilitoribacter nigricans]|nr:VCBS repeat-containing protein [Flavilitoribacter nigricans]
MFNPFKRLYPLALLIAVAIAACNTPPTSSDTVGVDPVFEKEVIYDQFISEGANVADVDNDGDLDILAGHYWFEAPDWQPHEIRQPETFDYTKGYSHSFLNFTEDVNQDGWADYICFDFPGEGVYWYENPGDKDQHWKEYLIDSTACNESPMTVDLDGDGRLELMFGNKDRGEMMWFQPPAEKGGTTWTGRSIGLPQEEGTRQYSHGLGWGDINGDGIKDIIVREGWWEVPADLSTYPWTFHPADLGLPCSQMYAYDFDGDGDQDVLSASAHAYGVWWHEQVPGEEGEIAFQRHLIDTSFSQTHGVAMLDMNGDDLPDFVTGKRFYAHQGKDPGGKEPPVIYWFELDRGEDGSVSWERHTIDDNSGIGIHVVVRDINGDGKLDILNGNKKGVIVFWGK